MKPKKTFRNFCIVWKSDIKVRMGYKAWDKVKVSKLVAYAKTDTELIERAKRLEYSLK